MWRQKSNAYYTWGCADELAQRLQKTLYYSEEEDCYETTSSPFTDIAVSMFLSASNCQRRKLTHRYASSLTRQLPISPCAIMLGILYSERLRHTCPVYLDRISSADLYVVSMLVATKFLVDEGETDEMLNDEWAEAGGLAVSTVNRLEREFLNAIEWNVYVSPVDFLRFCADIETKVALKCGLNRGWFTYTDLTQCLLTPCYQQALKNVIDQTFKVICGCSMLYGVSISLLAGSLACCTSSIPASLPNSTLLDHPNTVFPQEPCPCPQECFESPLPHMQPCSHSFHNVPNNCLHKLIHGQSSKCHCTKLHLDKQTNPWPKQRRPPAILWPAQRPIVDHQMAAHNSLLYRNLVPIPKLLGMAIM